MTDNLCDVKKSGLRERVGKAKSSGGETSDLTGDGGWGDRANMHGMNGPEMTKKLCDVEKSGVRERACIPNYVDGDTSDLHMDGEMSGKTVMNGKNCPEMTKKLLRCEHIRSEGARLQAKIC